MEGRCSDLGELNDDLRGSESVVDRETESALRSRSDLDVCALSMAANWLALEYSAGGGLRSRSDEFGWGPRRRWQSGRRRDAVRDQWEGEEA